MYTFVISNYKRVDDMDLHRMSKDKEHFGTKTFLRTTIYCWWNWKQDSGTCYYFGKSVLDQEKKWHRTKIFSNRKIFWIKTIILSKKMFLLSWKYIREWTKDKATSTVLQYSIIWIKQLNKTGQNPQKFCGAIKCPGMWCKGWDDFITKTG